MRMLKLFSFIVNCSPNGAEFSDVVQVQAVGNPTGTESYQALDPELPTGTVYYRLGQTDFDGTTTLTDVVSLTHEIGEDSKIRVIPNPGLDFIAVQLTGLVTRSVDVHLYSLDGKLVRSATIEPGSSMGFVDVQTLYAGNYLLVVNNGASSSVSQVAVMH